MQWCIELHLHLSLLVVSWGPRSSDDDFNKYPPHTIDMELVYLLSIVWNHSESERATLDQMFWEVSNLNTWKLLQFRLPGTFTYLRNDAWIPACSRAWTGTLIASSNAPCCGELGGPFPKPIVFRHGTEKPWKTACYCWENQFKCEFRRCFLYFEMHDVHTGFMHSWSLPVFTAWRLCRLLQGYSPSTQWEEGIGCLKPFKDISLVPCKEDKETGCLMKISEGRSFTWCGMAWNVLSPLRGGAGLCTVAWFGWSPGTGSAFEGWGWGQGMVGIGRIGCAQQDSLELSWRFCLWEVAG